MGGHGTNVRHTGKAINDRVNKMDTNKRVFFVGGRSFRLPIGEGEPVTQVQLIKLATDTIPKPNRRQRRMIEKRMLNGGQS